MKLPAASPLALVVVLLVNALVGRWAIASGAFNIDFLTLWSVSHALSATPFRGGPTPNIYDLEIQREMGAVIDAAAQAPDASPMQVRATRINASFYENRVDATASPFAFALVGVFSSGDFARDAARFQVLSFAAFLLALVLFCWLLRFPALGTMLALAFFGLAFAPVLADIRSANVNQLQLLALALFAYGHATGRYTPAGAALGLALSLKPNLAYVLLTLGAFALTQRHYERLARTMLGVLAVLSAAVGTSAVYFGSLGLWRDFLVSVPRTLGSSYTLERGNYGLSRLLESLTGAKLAEVLALGLLTVLVVLLLRRVAPARPKDEAFLVLGTAGPLLVFGSRLAWMHYYTFLIPGALFLLRPSDGATRSTAGLALVALILASDAILQVSTPFAESVALNLAAALSLLGCLIEASNTVEHAERVPVTPPGRRRKSEAV